MSALQNLRTYAVIAALFAAATTFNYRQVAEETGGRGLVLMPATDFTPTDVKLAPAPADSQNTEKSS